MYIILAIFNHVGIYIYNTYGILAILITNTCFVFFPYKYIYIYIHTITYIYERLCLFNIFDNYDLCKYNTYIYMYTLTYLCVYHCYFIWFQDVLAFRPIPSPGS
jgi:hypothetical protein